MAGLSQIFTQLGTIIDGSYQSQIGNLASKANAVAVSVAGMGIMIYAMLFALASLMGKVTEPWSEFIGRMAKPAAIVAIATTMYATVFNFPQLQTEMVTMVSGTSAYTQMDTMANTAVTKFTSTISIAVNAFKEGEAAAAVAGNADQSLTGVTGAVQGIQYELMGIVMGLFWAVVALIYIIAFFIMGVAAISIVIIADVFCHIAFAIGPIFVIALLSPYTARLFESWSGFALAQVFKWFFVSIVLVLASGAFSQIMGQMTSANNVASLIVDDSAGTSISALKSLALLDLPAPQVWLDLIALLIVGIVMNRIMLEVSGLAGSLAGGFSAQAMSFGQVMALAGTAKAAMAGASKLVTAPAKAAGGIADNARAESKNRQRDALERRIVDSAGGGARGQQSLQDARREAGYQTGQGARGGDYNKNLSAVSRAMGVPSATQQNAYRAGQVAAQAARIAQTEALPAVGSGWRK